MSARFAAGESGAGAAADDRLVTPVILLAFALLVPMYSLLLSFVLVRFRLARALAALADAENRDDADADAPPDDDKDDEVTRVSLSSLLFEGPVDSLLIPSKRSTCW